MCTVSVVTLSPLGSGFAPAARLRVSCNRDESPRRASAVGPIERTFGARRALLPIDPESGGTWIAVNDAGVAMALLNLYPDRRVSKDALSRRPSRGSIIPALLEHGSAGAALAAAQRIDPAASRPFQLVLVDPHAIAVVRCDGYELKCDRSPLDAAPRLFTTSGLGDARVDAPRRALFQQMVVQTSDRAAAQDHFHQHSWLDRPQLSVCMRRAEALTVCRTTIEIADGWASLLHHPAPPDEPAPQLSVSLELAKIP